MCLAVALSFIKLCDPSEMSFILAWSRSCALHQLNFYTGSQLCHSIHPQNKTPCLMISLSSILQMRHGLSKKKWEKMACPRSMTQKKWTQQCPWKKREKKEKKYIHIYPCPHVIQIKKREIHKRSISYHHPPSTYVHDLDQFIWFVISMDPLFDFAIYVTQVHASFLLPWAPDKLSLEVGWKQAILWWGYIHSEIHERSYGEVKLWLVYTKIFSKSKHMAGKWRRLKSIPFHSSTSQTIHGRHIKIHR